MAYKQNEKDRKDESKSMRDRRSFVTGNDPQIGRDSLAGLPQDVIMARYPKGYEDKSGIIDDSMSGIDATMSDSERLTKKFYSTQK